MLKAIRNVSNVRYYSIKHAAKKPLKYTSTINLPKTKFPNRLSTLARKDVECNLLENKFASAYLYQEKHNKEPTFVLHDGPPYANGDLHMGHAVNKVLKDVTLRHHVANGRKVHYIPGWDCHGLPIELKALTASGGNVDGGKQNSLAIRKKSRQYALDAIERQKNEFYSWGILADWNNSKNMYLTFQPDYIISQMEMFFKMYENNQIYRDLKPVYWSPSSRTALAEAELEYDANYVSPSLYVRFPMHNLPLTIAHLDKKVFAIIWTTTPWTLPSNQAICYNKDFEYSLVKLQRNVKTDGQELYLIATKLITDFETATELKTEVVETFKGSLLSECRYQHPISRDEIGLKFFAAPHVQDNKGTGLVHTAPAHGPEDFLVSLENNFQVISLVDEEGRYTSQAPAFLQGEDVLERGNQLVMQHISDAVIHASKITHSYPIDWRTKKPVILRASEQWFINTEKLKEDAVQKINEIKIYPRINSSASKKTLLTQVLKRPYWCISRQRVWGVPIPVFYNKVTGSVLVNKKIISHISNLVKENGNIDFWWSTPIDELLTSEILEEFNLNASDIVKGQDIFDIWFDSGSSWSHALKNNKIADLYLEGYDQFTGWFQSSLLTSIAVRNFAPYKSLFVHGFTVDEKGHKMSKSLGNVISPNDIIKKYGVDVLRWWVASHATQNMSITVSDTFLQQSSENISKLRSTLRYLNGVIGEKSDEIAVSNPDEIYLNKYLLSTLVEFDNEIEKSYNCYEYNRVVANIMNFVVNKISTIYVHSIKDRLYCGNDRDLQSIKITLRCCYEILCKALWPITPFLVEESWSYYDGKSAFHQQNNKTNSLWHDKHAINVVDVALEVKRLINQQVNDANTWTKAVEIKCLNSEKLNLLRNLQNELDTSINDSQLCEILQVNNVSLTSAHLNSSPELNQDFSVIVNDIQNTTLCPRCRRFSVETIDFTCVRCTNILNAR